MAVELGLEHSWVALNPEVQDKVVEAHNRRVVAAIPVCHMYRQQDLVVRLAGEDRILASLVLVLLCCLEGTLMVGSHLEIRLVDSCIQVLVDSLNLESKILKVSIWSRIIFLTNKL